MYSEKLLNHFRNPRNTGELDPPALVVDVSNPACGDTFRLSARFEGGVAAEVRYKVRGCTASIAAGSALTEWMGGKSVLELHTLTDEILREQLGGLPPHSGHAATLALDALHALLARLTE